MWLCPHSACKRGEMNCLRNKEELKYWLGNVCKRWCIYSYLLDSPGPLLQLLLFLGIRVQNNFFFTTVLSILCQTRDAHVKLPPKWFKMMCKCFTLLEQPHSHNVCAGAHHFFGNSSRVKWGAESFVEAELSDVFWCISFHVKSRFRSWGKLCSIPRVMSENSPTFFQVLLHWQQLLAFFFRYHVWISNWYLLCAYLG